MHEKTLISWNAGVQLLSSFYFFTQNLEVKMDFLPIDATIFMPLVSLSDLCLKFALHASFQLQLSFQMWTNQMQETLNSKKHGDSAFRAKDFGTAIEYYTQVCKGQH